MTPYLQLINILNKNPTMVGVVLSIYTSTKKSKIELVGGGGIMMVSGVDYTVGKKVYIKNNIIIGEAPNLPTYEIEV